MEIVVDFPGGARVDAHFGSFVVATDQPAGFGGDGSAPSPFEVFLASLATCAGVYVQGFCKMRGIPTDGIRLVQKAERSPESKMVTRISLDIQLPEGFPQQYTAAVIRAAESCLVKKHIEKPPVFETTVSIASLNQAQESVREG
jgi:ribosomal protein S12 methylthiotransferase accessory factor